MVNPKKRRRNAIAPGSRSYYMLKQVGDEEKLKELGLDKESILLRGITGNYHVHSIFGYIMMLNLIDDLADNASLNDCKNEEREIGENEVKDKERIERESMLYEDHDIEGIDPPEKKKKRGVVDI